MQPNQGQTNIPAQPQPANPPVNAYQPTVQPINQIVAPSQAELQPTVGSLTTPGVSQFVGEPPIEPAPDQPQPTVQEPTIQPPVLPPQAQVQPQPQVQTQPQTPQLNNQQLGIQNQRITKKQQARKATAQNSLLISEIRENMVIMNDGSFRAVVACDSINYDLMSSEERDGIEYSYQNFLNTLYFPVQIIIQSRRIDLKPYTEKLEKIRSEQENMLLGVLMDEYLDFIFDISQQANIMRKDFFVVIPYYLTGDTDSAVNSFKNLSEGVLSSVQKPSTNIKINASDYEKAKSEIKNRVSTVVNGLMSIGVRAGQLPTRALSELYYNFYNPDTAIDQPVANFDDYTGLYSTKGAGESPLPGMGNI